ncbi:hypothetical protein JB92DRAFT_2836363 [Gautieria morchelliformis]|nr:hypothetical protein JB92DRAFT_2836363 [Gautieria morchelliformis]
MRARDRSLIYGDLAHLSPLLCWCWEKIQNTKSGCGSHGTGVANLGATLASGGTRLAARGHTSVGWDAGAQLPSCTTLVANLGPHQRGWDAGAQLATCTAVGRRRAASIPHDAGGQSGPAPASGGMPSRSLQPTRRWDAGAQLPSCTTVHSRSALPGVHPAERAAPGPHSL